MQVPRFGSSRTVEFNVTPLIDVVFLLIIFFLVSSKLAQQETQIELTLPEAESGRDMTESTVPRVTLNLLPDGQLLLGSAPITIEQLTRHLEEERAQTTGELEVRIRADREIPYRFVEPVLLACAEAQIWNIAFAVVEEEQ